MPKQRTSFALSVDALSLLKKLAEKNERSQASMVEILIKEAAKKEKLRP